MDRALDAGINFFDTANVYGWKKGEGITEQIVGRWFAQGGGRREKVVIATKLYGSMSDWPNDTFLSARNIRHACEGSLRRLQTDYIDLYQMHHVDRDTPWDEIWEAMEVLVQQGKVLYVGSSNFAGWHIAQAQETAQARHFLGLGQRAVPLQPRRAARRGGGDPGCAAVRRRHHRRGARFMRGLLGGILAKQPRRAGRRRSVTQKAAHQAPPTASRRTRRSAPSSVSSPSAVGLAWLLRSPASPRRSSGRGRSSSSKAICMRSTCTSMMRRSTSSTRCSRAWDRPRGLGLVTRGLRRALPPSQRDRNVTRRQA